MGSMASGSHFLGIDVGSSGVKVMLVRSDGRPFGVASAGYATSYPHPGHVEQNPDDWYDATCVAVREVLTKTGVGADRVRGIGLSGTSHVPSMLDENMRLVRPGILWNDIRSEAQVRRLAHEAGELIKARTGNSINCTWSLAQMAWVREHEAGAFSRVRHVLFSKDYLAYRLTGVCAADHSSAASSLLVDADSLNWNHDLLRMAGLMPDAVPPIHPSTAVIGGLTSAAASDAGLAAGRARGHRHAGLGGGTHRRGSHCSLGSRDTPGHRRRRDDADRQAAVAQRLHALSPSCPAALVLPGRNELGDLFSAMGPQPSGHERRCRIL